MILAILWLIFCAWIGGPLGFLIGLLILIMAGRS